MTLKSKFEDVRYWSNRKSDDPRLDWRNGGGSWIEEYVASSPHPHRDLILKTLKKNFPDFQSLLEVGCNAGPNLLRIREVHPTARLMGIDVNYDAVVKARETIPEIIVHCSSVEKLPPDFEDNYFDLVLADAVLMYVENIDQALSEMSRVAKRGIIILDWFAEEECILDFHHARNYPKLLEGLGFETEIINLTEKDWPSEKWIKNGRLFISQRV